LEGAGKNGMDPKYAGGLLYFDNDVNLDSDVKFTEDASPPVVLLGKLPAACECAWLTLWLALTFVRGTENDAPVSIYILQIQGYFSQ
jgi:hypothetical protein